MALIATALNGTVTATFTVNTSDTVTALVLANGSTSTVRFDVTRPSGAVNTTQLAPGGSTTVSIAKGKQFAYSASTADWTFSLTVL